MPAPKALTTRFSSCTLASFVVKALEHQAAKKREMAGRSHEKQHGEGEIRFILYGKKACRASTAAFAGGVPADFSLMIFLLFLKMMAKTFDPIIQPSPPPIFYIGHGYHLHLP